MFLHRCHSIFGGKPSLGVEDICNAQGAHTRIYLYRVLNEAMWLEPAKPEHLCTMLFRLGNESVVSVSTFPCLGKWRLFTRPTLKQENCT